MRNFLLTAALVAATGLGPVWAQDVDLLDRWVRSSPEKRSAARELLNRSYPELVPGLEAHLASRYPQFELKVLKALAGFRETHPGLVAAIARHLLEDLQGEPLDACLDVVDAVALRYPTLGARLRELRRTQGPGLRVRELIAGRYPQLRSEVLQLLSEESPGELPELLAATRKKHRRLGFQVLWEASRLADERYPGLTREFLQARRDGSRPLPWLLDHHPEFVREAARRIYTHHGESLRQAAIEALGQLEAHAAERRPSFGKRLLGLLESRYPELPAQLHQSRWQAARALRGQIRQEFPELPALVAQTMQKEHPQLLTRAAESLRKHFPTLREELWTALETQLPNLRQEVKGYLRMHHPDLSGELERIL